MKNPVTILLLTVHLFAYMDIVQVFKFPKLIEHYREHHSKNKSVGFIDFLVMHYVKCDDGDPKDDREDMQLPFKSMDIHIIGNAIVVPQFSVISEEQTESYHDFFYSYYTRIIPSTLKRSLFRPPIFQA